MITRYKVAVMTIITSASIAIGAVVGHASPIMDTHGQTTSNRAASARTTRPTGTIDMPNLTSPMISEDRYVNGEWIGHPAPLGLPHASGQCDPCIP